LVIPAVSGAAAVAAAVVAPGVIDADEIEAGGIEDSAELAPVAFAACAVPLGLMRAATS
jgi:hypothetical protein